MIKGAYCLVIIQGVQKLVGHLMSVHSSDVGLCKAKVFRLFFFNFFDGVEIFIFTTQFLDYDKFRLLFKYETHF